MYDAAILIPALVTIIGIVITTFVVTHQITLQRRLGYITLMLNDSEIMHWYKVFLKDLRFIYGILEIYPNLVIDNKNIDFSYNNQELNIKLEFLTAYIRHVLRNDERLRKKHKELSSLTNDCYDPIIVFSEVNRHIINPFVDAIFHGLKFHLSRAWFVALFNPASKRYSKLHHLIKILSSNPTMKTILSIENEIKKFMLGKW